jgi:hypothetical protein
MKTIGMKMSELKIEVKDREIIFSSQDSGSPLNHTMSVKNLDDDNPVSEYGKLKLAKFILGTINLNGFTPFVNSASTQPVQHEDGP